MFFHFILAIPGTLIIAVTGNSDLGKNQERDPFHALNIGVFSW
jgi:hypothetical protein